MGHAERIIAEISTLDENEQATLLAFVERLKAGRALAKAPELTAAQARDRDALEAELAPFRVALAGYKFDREERMPGKAFVDTNILIYAVGEDDARRAVADALIVQDAVISAQVLAEAASVLGRKFHLPAASVERILESIGARARCEPLTAEMVMAAVRWSARLGYSHYDSQIIAAALAADCSVLYSEDMQHGHVIDGRLTIVNPFIA